MVKCRTGTGQRRSGSEEEQDDRAASVGGLEGGRRSSRMIKYLEVAVRFCPGKPETGAGTALQKEEGGRVGNLEGVRVGVG
jgi:hypothetical protein